MIPARNLIISFALLIVIALFGEGITPLGTVDASAPIDHPSLPQSAALQSAPSNDLFANAFEIFDGLYKTDFNLELATVSGTDPVASCVGDYQHSIWYKYVDDRPLFVSVYPEYGAAPEYDTFVEIFTGSEGALTSVACDDNSNDGLNPWLLLDNLSFDTYYILIGIVGSAPLDSQVTISYTIDGYAKGVAGTVYEADGVTPIQGAYVDLLTVPYPIPHRVLTQITNISGQYFMPFSILGVANSLGTLYIFAAGEEYALEYWDSGGMDLDNATPITGGFYTLLTGVDFTLEPGGSILGVIDGYDAQEQKQVNVFELVSATVANEGIDIQGCYVFAPIGEPDQYLLMGLPLNVEIKVVAGLGGSSPCHYGEGTPDLEPEYAVAEYYQETPDLDQATTLILTESNRRITDVNFTVEFGGMIAGNVVDEGSQTPIADASVCAYDQTATQFDEASAIVCGKTDANGDYLIADLPVDQVQLADQMRVRVFADNYQNAFYATPQLADNPQDATPVDVLYFQTTSGINFTLPLVAPTAPILEPPTRPDGTDQVTYRWDAVATATDYQIQVEDGLGGIVLDQVVAAGTVCTGSTCAYTDAAAYAVDDYVVRVRASNTSGDSPWSADVGFIVPDWTPDNSIYGFAGQVSVNTGENVDLYISTTAATYDITAYRIGWYGGAGAQYVTSALGLAGSAQGVPLPQADTGLIEADWAVSTTLNTTGWQSGLYSVRLSASNGDISYLSFVVRDDSSTAPILFQIETSTWQAYNGWGGKSLYTFNSQDSIAATHVSYDRPYEDGDGAGDLYEGDYQMIRWLEREGYEVTYATNEDMHANPNLLNGRSIFLSNYHDEYWSWEMRQNLTNARDAGTHLAFFTANNIYWQTRYAASRGGVPNRIIICYKSEAADPISTTSPNLTTVQWRQPPVNMPENELLGIMYEGNFGDNVNYDYVVSNSSHWIYNGTGLTDGSIIPEVIGDEYDRIFTNGLTPSNLVSLSNSPIPATGGVSNAAIYTAPSGAYVFGASTNHWALKLDDTAYDTHLDVDTRIQQMTRNLLDTMLGDMPVPPVDGSHIIFDDALGYAWQNNNSPANFLNSSPVANGNHSLALNIPNPSSFARLSLRNLTFVDTSSFDSLKLSVYPTVGNVQYQVYFWNSNNTNLTTVVLDNYGGRPPAGQWTNYTIPLADLGADNQVVQWFWIRPVGISLPHTVYFDDIYLFNDVAGSIAGTITAPAEPDLTQVAVCAIPDDVTLLDTSAGTCTFAQANGSYEIPNLQPDNYRVWALPVESLRLFYASPDLSTTFAGAAMVPVTAETQTANIDFNLPQSSKIAGTVIDENSQPIEGVTVSLEGGLYQSCTDAQGQYTLHVPAASDHIVQASAGICSNNNDIFLTQFYDGQFSSAGATAVATTLGATTSGIDFVRGDPNTGVIGLEIPSESSTVNPEMTLMGWAVDPAAGAGNGTGIDTVDVYEGDSCIGTPLNSVLSMNQPRPDVSSFLGLDASYDNNGFVINLDDLPIGSFTFTVCAHPTGQAAGIYATSVTRTVTVEDSQGLMNLDLPSNGDVMLPNISIAGWAIDPIGGAGVGPGIDYVDVYQGTSCAIPGNRVPPASDTPLDVSRPDVATFFGLDSSYDVSGFATNINDVPAGTFTFTVCGHRAGQSADVYAVSMSRTVTVIPTGGRISVEVPAIGASTASSFEVAGWALDIEGGAGNGPGMDRVDAYMGYLCSGPLLGSGTPELPRGDVATFFGLDSSYDNSGYVLGIENMPAGSLMFTVCAHRAGDPVDQYASSTTRRVTIAATSGQMNVELPASGSQVSPAFSIQGWTIDTVGGAGAGPGIDYVEVYSGVGCDDPANLLTPPSPVGLNVSRPDVPAFFGLDASYTDSGFAIPINNAFPGAFRFTVCAHQAGQPADVYAAQMTRTVTVVEDGARMQIEGPANLSSVASSFDVTGWALDLDAGAGNGPGMDQIDVYQGLVCSGTLVGSNSLSVARPDVAGFFGLDASFDTSGFAVNIASQPDGDFTFTICAHRTGDPASEYAVQISRQVTIDSGLNVLEVPREEPVVALPQMLIEAEDAETVTANGTWTAYDSAAASGGAYLYSSGALDDTLSLDFVGTQVALMIVQHPSLGQFVIQIDGADVQTGDLSGAETLGETVVVTGLSDGVHTLTIVPQNGMIALDAVLVEGLPDVIETPEPAEEPTSEPTVEPTEEPTEEPTSEPTEEPLTTPDVLVEAEDTATVIANGAWTTYDSAAASGGQYIYSSGALDDTLSLDFVGTQVALTIVQHPSLGQFTVQIDGADVQTVDLSGVEALGETVLVTGLSDGIHTLTIVPLNGMIALDAVLVDALPEPILTPEPTAEPTEESTSEPTVEPTAEPTIEPTSESTVEPTEEPTSEPTEEPLALPALLVEAEDATMVSINGAWMIYESANASGGQYVASSGAPEDSLSLDFVGTQVALVVVQNPSFGQFVIQIDGTIIDTVDLSMADAFGETILVTGLSDGAHTLTIVPMNGMIALDAVLVDALPEPTVTPEPTDEPMVTPEPTEEPTNIPTETPTLTPSATPTDVPTETSSPTATETVTELPSATPTLGGEAQ